MPGGIFLHAGDPHAGGSSRLLIRLPSRLLTRSQGGAEGTHHAVLGRLVGNTVLFADVRTAARHGSIPGFARRQHAAILTWKPANTWNQHVNAGERGAL